MLELKREFLIEEKSIRNSNLFLNKVLYYIYIIIYIILLFYYAREEKVDISIISEQYKDLRGPNSIRDNTSKAAIWVCGSFHISSNVTVPGSSFTWVEVAGIRIHSCYLVPSNTIEEFQRSLDAIVTSAR